MAENDLSKRVLTLKRTFDAPVDLVWEAWTEPGHIAQWWGPKGMVVKVVEHNFKPGGKWKYVMPMPNGGEFISEGAYLEIVELRKIVTSANFRPMTEGVQLRALFEKAGAQTIFTFSIVHPTEEYCKQQEKMGFYNGWGSTFERLNGYLATVIKK
jgi:uncharacterized protein YndB with AHSA1/START domain